MPNIKVTIHLDPEFGWTATKPVYGPGSVFKGIVRVQNASNQPIERLLIVFQASETLSPSSSTAQSHQEQFFGSQRVLWNSKFGSVMQDDMEFPFTIQFPMVQFPPSIEIDDFYACRYQLVSCLEGPSKQLLAKDTCPVTYLPQIETRTCKEYSRMFCLEAQDKQQRKFKIQLGALDYLPGDVIEPFIYQPPSHRMHIKLLQVLTILSNGKSSKVKRSVVEALGTSFLELPQDLVPSFGYGRVVSVSYELQVSFTKLATSSENTLKSLVSLKSSRAAVTFADIPIRIGTLGYGIPASDELQVYTAFKRIFGKDKTSDAAPVLPAPKYVSSIEYKDALPQYEDYQLPAYQDIL